MTSNATESTRKTLHDKMTNTSQNQTIENGNLGSMLYGFTIYDLLLIIIACCIVFINIYVVSLFVRKRNLRKKSSLLLLSLTMSDLFTGIVTVPLIVAATPLQYLDFEKFKIIFILGDMATVLSASLIILSLCAVTADRYVKLCYPIRHFVLVQSKWVLALFCGIWTTAIVYSSIPFIWLYEILYDNPSDQAYANAILYDTRYAIAGAILFAVPVVGLTVAFSRMFYAIYQLGRKERRRSSGENEEMVRRKRERKAIIIFSLMFVAFMICWAPWIFLRPFMSDDSVTKIPTHFLNFLMLIRFLTSIFNPLMYTLHEADFHRALIMDKEKLVGCLCCNPNRGRSKSFSMGTESFLKHSFLKTSRRGTLVDKEKSQAEAGNFGCSPVVRNGFLHPGDFHDYNGRRTLGTTRKQETEVAGTNEAAFLLPELMSHEVSHTNKTELAVEKRREKEQDGKDIDKYWDENEFEEKKWNHRKLTSQKSAYDNVESIFNEGLNHVSKFVDWSDTEVLADKTTEIPKDFDVLTKSQDGRVENGGILDGTSHGKSFKPGRKEESTRSGDCEEEFLMQYWKKQQTVKLLKTSFIGKLFQTEEASIV